MAKKNKKSKTPKFQIGDYVRIDDEDVIGDIDIDVPKKEFYGVIVEIYGAIWTNNADYAEYSVQLQGYPHIQVTCVAEEIQKV